MSFESCIMELAAARGKDIPKFVLQQIEGIYEEAGEIGFKRIINELVRLDHMPSNIYGAIKARWEDARNLRDKSYLSRDNWPVKEECTTPEEFKAFFEVVNEIILWHSTGLKQSNPDGCNEPLTIEEWIKSGRPKTWSPIFDHFLKGYESAYKTDLQCRGALLDFLWKYVQTLRQTRVERTQKNFVKK